MSIAPANRTPLEPTTNRSISPPPSPPTAADKSDPQALRHKTTHYNLNSNLDSSESYPSTHSSLYDAQVTSSQQLDWEWDIQTRTSEADGTLQHAAAEWHFGPSTTADYKPASWENRTCDQDGNSVPLSFLKPISPQRIHTPHELYPITEQSSAATLRPSLSIKDKASLTTMRSRSPGLPNMKRKSFSLSDLPPRSEPPSTPHPPPLPAPLPVPNQPIIQPPVRSPTPPGLPTFNRPEAINYRLTPPPNVHRLTRNFRSFTPEEREWRSQTVGLPKGVIMRGEGGVLVRGKFVPTRSGHLPPQSPRQDLWSAPSPSLRLAAQVAVSNAEIQVDQRAERLALKPIVLPGPSDTHYSVAREGGPGCVATEPVGDTRASTVGPLERPTREQNCSEPARQQDQRATAQIGESKASSKGILRNLCCCCFETPEQQKEPNTTANHNSGIRVLTRSTSFLENAIPERQEMIERSQMVAAERGAVAGFDGPAVSRAEWRAEYREAHLRRDEREGESCCRRFEGVKGRLRRVL